MYLIAGLGNPGNQYKYTRHNIGFVAIDFLSVKYNISVRKINFKSLIGEGSIKGEKVILMKPSTFMNLSGDAIGNCARFYKIPPENIIIICDDVALDTGRLRIRPSGSDGGHNGLKSIISHLNSDMFTRIRIGAGKPQNDMINHVLGTFGKDEGKKVTSCIKLSDKIVEEIISSGVESAMNKFNGTAF